MTAPLTGPPPIAGARPPIVPDGPRAHRRDLRRRGALAGLLVPALVGLAALAVLWGSDSPVRGVLGLVLAVAAAPLLPLFGAPAVGGARVLAGIVASGVLWMVLGSWAARRATRTPVSSWPEWRREYRRLALGAATGGVLALVLAAVGLTLLAR